MKPLLQGINLEVILLWWLGVYITVLNICDVVYYADTLHRYTYMKDIPFVTERCLITYKA